VEIPDDATVWRAIPCKNAIPDPDSPGHYRFSGGHFSESSDGSGMSVDLTDAAVTADAFLVGWPCGGIAELTVGDIRAAGAVLRLDPIPNNPRHVTVHYHGTRTNRAKLAQALSRAARWVREPTPACP